MGAMSDRAGGWNQKPLIGARASALPKNGSIHSDICDLLLSQYAFTDTDTDMDTDTDTPLRIHNNINTDTALMILT